MLVQDLVGCTLHTVKTNMIHAPPPLPHHGHVASTVVCGHFVVDFSGAN